MHIQQQLPKASAARVQLSPRTHFFIGSYLLLTSLGIDFILSGFTTDTSPLRFLTVELLELVVFSATGLGVFLSIIALFWGHRRHVRASSRSFWNTPTKHMSVILILWFLFMYLLTYHLLQNATEQQIIPTLLLGYAFLLAALNFSKQGTLYSFSLLSFILGALSFYIAGIGFKCLFVLGLFQILFGFSLRINKLTHSAS